MQPRHSHPWSQGLLFSRIFERSEGPLDDTQNLRDTFCADIRYADDTTLISAIFDKLKISTEQLNMACKKWGMKINGAKCNIISPSPEEITIDGAQREHVGQFTFLGSVVPPCSEDVNRRISLAAAAFGRLRTAVWNRREIGMALKVRLYNALILPIATYAAETWTLKAEDTRKLEAFEMRCLRVILGVTLRQRLRNEHVRAVTTVTTTIPDIITKKRLKWFGHVTRRLPESYVARAYRQDFPKPRSRGRPPKRWSSHIREDTGLPLATAERRASVRGCGKGELPWRARGPVEGYAIKSSKSFLKILMVPLNKYSHKIDGSSCGNTLCHFPHPIP